MSEVDRLRIAADLQGTAIALVQPGFILVLDTNLDPTAELGIPGDLDDHDVTFVDGTGRLAVLTRTANQTILHVVDPAGPTKLGEVTFRASARVAAAAGDHVLIVGGTVSVVDVMADPLTTTQLPVRGHVGAVGRLGYNKFILSIGGVLEEWDAKTHAPGRRMRLDHPIDPLFVGGNAHHLWSVPKKQPDVIDVITLGSRSTRRIELPEPASRIDPHVSGYVLVMLGATSKSAFIIDLVRATVTRVEGGPISDVAWLGHRHTLVIKPVQAPLELLTITMPADHAKKAAEKPERSIPERSIPERSERSSERTGERPPVAPPPKREELPPTKWTRDDITERLAAWRAKYADKTVADVATSPIVKPEVSPPQTPTTEHPGGWRAELAFAVRAFLAGTKRDLPTIGEHLDDIITHVELPDGTRDAIALLYGAYLAGARIAPVDLAGVLGWDWSEALGGGALAATDFVRWSDGRVRLHRELVALLDERPPIHGTIVPVDERPATGAVAIVAPADVAPEQVGAWAAPAVGSLLVPNDACMDKRGFVREARLRGVAPLVRWTEYAAMFRVPPQPAAIVVEQATTAATLALPVVATWSS